MLDQIDAVFVTLELGGSSHKPSGRSLLFPHLKVALLGGSLGQIACHFDDAGAKITFGIIMWTPLLPSTSSVMLRSAETLDSM